MTQNIELKKNSMSDKQRNFQIIFRAIKRMLYCCQGIIIRFLSLFFIPFTVKSVEEVDTAKKKPT